MNPENKSSNLSGSFENSSSDSDNVFVVPEPDGIKSGHPLQDVDFKDNKNTDSSSSGYNKRFKYNLNKANSASTSKMLAKQKTKPSYFSEFSGLNGISIKTKIMASLIALGFIIVIVGVISLISFREMSNISKGITDKYSKTARLTDAISIKTLRIRDAEKNFRLIGEEEALERIARYTNFIRETIKELDSLAKAAELNGTKLNINSKSLTDTMNKFESLLATQVKDLRTGEKSIKEQLSKAAIDMEKRLQLSEELRQRNIKRLLSDYWNDLKSDLKDSKKDDKEAAKEAKISVQIFKMLNDLEKNSLNLEVSSHDYINLKANFKLESVQSNITNCLTIIEQIKRENLPEKISSQLDDIYKNLTEYFALFKEMTSVFNEIKLEESRINTRIKSQDLQLASLAEELINTSDELAERSWADISSEGLLLNKTANNTQLLLLIIVTGGLITGLIVLFAVPKPIINGINALIYNAQNLASGDLTKEIQIFSNDELGQLASTFEWMRKNLLSLIERIHKASIQISTTVNEIQAASNEQTSTTNEQASAFNQVTATFSEIARTASSLAKVAEKVSESTIKVTNWISDSNKKSGQIIDSMNAINESTKQTSERVKRLNDQMDSINDAVNTISGVADQTTLLSLNAAIEANKAGEMGKGFSVVAGEIRRLSDRSIDSASKIASMIRDIQRATESSVVAMDKTVEEIRLGISLVHESTNTVSGINDAMTQVRDQILDISNNIQDYASSSSQIQQSMTDLQDSTKMSAQATRQNLSAAYELSAMANQLAEAVSAFKL